MRGGDQFSIPGDSRSASRSWNYPYSTRVNTGIRVVLAPGQP